MAFDIGSYMNPILNFLMPWAVFFLILFLLYLPLKKLGYDKKIGEFFTNTYEKAFGNRETNQSKEKGITYE